MGIDERGFEVLPQDCLVGVFRFLQTEDLQSAAGTCKTSWEASEDPMLSVRLDLSHTLHSNPEGLLCSLLAPPSRRAQHVEAIATSFCKHITGSFLQHFNMTPSVRLHTLDLSRCVTLELRHLVSCLPAVSPTLTSLSLRHNDHLLHDDAIDQILHALVLPPPPSPSPKAAGTIRGATTAQGFEAGDAQASQLARVRLQTGLRSLDLGTSTRRAARSSPLVLTATSLALLAHTCPHLGTLSLTNQEWVTDAALEALLASSHPPAPLTSLDLGLCSALTDRGVLLLAHACPSLRVLSLRSVWRVTSSSVAALLQRCPRLESINLNGCSFVGPEAFHAALLPPSALLLPEKSPIGPPAFSALRALNLSSMQRLGDDDLVTIARHTGYRLREVSVSKCDGITDRGLVSLCLSCPWLNLLNVADCIHVTAHFVHMLAEAHGDLMCWEGRLPRPHGSSLPPLASLTTLNARHAVGWTDETTHLLLSSQGCGATNLRTLYLGGCTGAPPGEATAAAHYETNHSFGGLTDRSVHRIAAVLQRGLECLDLHGCQSVTDSGLATLAHRCPRLRRLTLSGLDLLSDSTLQVIRKSLLCLTELNLSCCRGLTDRAVHVLRRQRPDITKLTHRRTTHLQGSSWGAIEAMGREMGGGTAPAPRGGVDPRVKLLIDTKIMELQFRLIRLDEGGAASEEDMRTCVPWFQVSHYEAVVEERAINGACGYPGCEASLPASRSEGRFILDPKRGKVTQVNREQSMYCSDMCHFASRRFASGLSGEGTVFRPAVQAYVHAHLTSAATAEGGCDSPAEVKSPATLLGLPTAKSAPKAPRKFKPKPLKAEGPPGVDKEAGHVCTPGGKAGEAGPGAQQASQAVKKGVVKEEAAPQEGPLQGAARAEPVGSTAHDKPKGPEGKPPLRPILKKGPGTGVKTAASAGAKRVSIDEKAPEKRESKGDERMPLKFDVRERDAPAPPKPLEVGAVCPQMIEGFQPSTKPPKPPRTHPKKPKKDTSDKGGKPEDASATEDEDDEEDEDITSSDEEEEGADDDSAAGVWEFGENVGDDEDGPSILEQDAFVQLWDAVSGLLTPVSIHYVRKVAAGEDVATALASLQVDPQPADFAISRRLTSLADLLGPFLKPAAKMLRLTVEPAELYDRIRGLLTTLDLSHSMASLPSSRYKAMALLFVDACFPPKATDESSDEVMRTTVESLAGLGLSADEYASIRGDLSSSAGLADA